MKIMMTNEIKDVLDCIPSGMGVYRMEQGLLYPQYHNPAFYTMRMTAARCWKT